MIKNNIRADINMFWIKLFDTNTFRLSYSIDRPNDPTYFPLGVDF